MSPSSNTGPVSASVTVAARLHLGFLDLGGAIGRRFGSLGLAVDEFRTRVTLRRAGAERIEGAEAARAGAHLRAARTRLGLEEFHHLVIEEVIPPHAGLGSGTQLALAVAAALRRLHGLPLDASGDAAMLGRGARSGIGIGLFETGGFVVDAGRGDATVVPPIVGRLPFPEEWRALVVLDPTRRGLHGADERNAFQALAPMPTPVAQRLCHLVLMKALPAVAERDLQRFGEAVKEIQEHVGDHFAPQQGNGRFASADVAAVLACLDREGAHGIGQSSWGPTGFAFAPTQADAERLAATARRHPSASALDIRIASGLNRGAEIEVVAAPGA